MKAGAVDFLAKPFDDKELLNAVRQAIDRSSPRPPSLSRAPLRSRPARGVRLLTPRGPGVVRVRL